MVKSLTQLLLEAEYQPPARPNVPDALLLHSMSPEEKQAARELKKQYEDAFDAWLASVPEKQAIVFRDEWDWTHLNKGREWKGVRYAAVTRDPSGGWRVTRFCPTLEMPVGHEEFPTRLAAAKSLATWERIPRLPFTVKAGEFHSQRTPRLIYRPANGPEEEVAFGGYMAGGVTCQVRGSDGEWKVVSVDDLSRPG